MKAYHFLKDNMTGGYGNELPWKIGEERAVEGELKMCEWGYHASSSFYDALLYAKGSTACIVELSGDIIADGDKYVARKRRLIDARNAAKVLRAWACACAERALRKSKVSDERCWNAIKIARLYNEGKVSEKDLAATRAAAWAARDGAATKAARAAGDAAWAVWAARAAGAAAKATEIEWQRKHLNKLMKLVFEEEK